MCQWVFKLYPIGYNFIMKYDIEKTQTFNDWFSSMNEKVTKFDIAKYLETDEDIAEFLNEVIQTGDTSDFIHALGTVARARGMTEIANRAGVTRASLYKSLAEDSSPRFDTISKVISAMGCKLSVSV